MIVTRKRKLEKMPHADFLPTSNIDTTISSIFHNLKRKIEKKALGERVLLGSDLRSFIQTNPNQENLETLLKAAGPQSLFLIKKILNFLIDQDNNKIQNASEMLQKLTNLCLREESLTAILSHAIRHNYPIDLQLEIANKFLSIAPSCSSIFEVLQESTTYLKSFAPEDLPITALQLTCDLTTRFLSKMPTKPLLIRLFYHTKHTLELRIPERPPSILYPQILEPLIQALSKSELIDKDLILLFIDSVETGHQELSDFFLNALLNKPRSIRFFHQLQEHPEVHNSPYAFSLIDKILLQAAFSIYADDEDLQNYDFQSLANEDPQLFHLFLSWITTDERGLVHAAHFLDEDLRPSFVSTVLSIMKFAQDNTEFRPIATKELQDTLTDCVDRSTLAINNLLLQKKLFESEEMPIASILEIHKAKIAADVLREFSARLGEQKKDGDPIEIQLYLESLFREEFGLIGAIQEQRFDAYVKPGDIIRARAAINQVLNNPETLSDLLIAPDEHRNDSPWVKKLKKIPIVAKQMAAIHETSYRLLESFNETDWKTSLTSLSRNDQNLFAKLLEKHQFKGPEVAKYDALNEMVFLKLQELFRKKTLSLLSSSVHRKRL